MSQFKGWTKIRRGVLDHLQSGRLNTSTFAAWAVLALLADAAKGSGVINAPILVTYLTDMTKETAQRTLKSLQDNGFIFRYKPNRGDKKGKPYWINKFEASRGKNKMRRLDLSQVLASKDLKDIRWVDIADVLEDDMLGDIPYELADDMYDDAEDDTTDVSEDVVLDERMGVLSSDALDVMQDVVPDSYKNKIDTDKDTENETERNNITQTPKKGQMQGKQKALKASERPIPADPRKTLAEVQTMNARPKTSSPKTTQPKAEDPGPQHPVAKKLVDLRGSQGELPGAAMDRIAEHLEKIYKREDLLGALDWAWTIEDEFWRSAFSRANDPMASLEKNAEKFIQKRYLTEKRLASFRKAPKYAVPEPEIFGVNDGTYIDPETGDEYVS